MLAVTTNAGSDRYGAAGEFDALFATVRGWNGERPPLVWCHGNNGTALGDYTGYNGVLRLLAQRYVVCAADLGGSTFGNDTGVTRTGQVLDYMLNGAEPAVLVGASMGALVALNYAVRFPERVRAVVGIIPALDLNVLPDNPALPNINLAYPPAYSDAEYGDHNPVLFADELPAEMPVHLWTSSDDPICYPATADAFVAARPQTERTVFGAYGHGGIAIAAPLVADWLKASGL